MPRPAVPAPPVRALAALLLLAAPAAAQQPPAGKHFVRVGTNPWGTSMVVGLPRDGVTPRKPHSVVAEEVGLWTQTGGLVDGPVYRSIFTSLAYVRLHEPDEYTPFNTLVRTALNGGFGRAPAGAGSGFGSVGEQTTLANGVETRRKRPRRVSPLRAEIPHAGLALASSGAPTRLAQARHPPPCRGR
ncbi:MAG TPA: hypothetical protein VF615_06615, partial [Longimicrobiaceae bacterium]